MGEQGLAVIIVTYNSRHQIGDCLSSLFADLDGTKDVDVVVVDNGSTDGTIEYIRAYWPRINLLVQAKNRGFAAANNVGLRAAQGDRLLLLNPDTVVHAGTIGALNLPLSRHPEVGVVGPKLLNPDGSLQPSCRDFPSLFGDFVGMSEVHRLSILRPILSANLVSLSDHCCSRKVDWISGACLLIRRQAVLDSGPLDDGYFMYSEEMEWQYRMQKKGWQVCFDPNATVTHIGGASTESVPGKRIIWQYASIYRFYRQHRTRFQQLMLRLIVWGATLPKLVYLTLLGTGSPRRQELRRAFWKILWL